MQPCLSPDLELSATDFTNGSYWFWFCLLLPGEGSVNLFIYSCLLNDKFVIPCLFHVIRKISMVGCRITFGLRPHVIRRPTIDIFPYYVNKQGITNKVIHQQPCSLFDSLNYFYTLFNKANGTSFRGLGSLCHRPSNCNLSNLCGLCKSLAPEIVSWSRFRFAESLRLWRNTRGFVACLSPPVDSRAFGARARSWVYRAESSLWQRLGARLISDNNCSIEII